MTDWIAALLLLAGSLLMLLAVATFFGSAEVWARVLAIIAFIMLTAPVAAHMIGRAGYFVGVPLWGRILRDDLKDRYDQQHHTLESPEEFTERRQPADRRPH